MHRLVAWGMVGKKSWHMNGVETWRMDRQWWQTAQPVFSRRAEGWGSLLRHKNIHQRTWCTDEAVPMGSLVTGTPAEAKLWAIKSLRAWCLADLPRALLHTKLWSPRASTSEPQWHWCGVQRSKPNLKPTVTLTASSSSLNPHDAIGRANSQSPLCWEEVARKDAWLFFFLCPPAQSRGREN